MTDQSQPLLNSLCSICNVEPSQYRCPRCSARTCSVPCYKRHQQWAQCSGKRDATAYMKKSELATPSGIDHDYNFLSGIERGIERADREDEDRKARSRENGAAPPEGAKRTRARPGSLYHQRLMDTGVTVKRAPAGMTRARENRTRVSGKNKSGRHLIWSVEWILDDGSRHLSEVFESTTVADAYRDMRADLRTLKRKPDYQPQARKHEKRHRRDESGVHDRDQSPEAQMGEERHTTAEDNPKTRPEDGPDDVDESKMPSSASSIVGTARGKQSTAPTNSEEVANDASEPERPRHFYLHRPLTPATSLVLIPLNGDQPLHDTLRSRTVLEYPTIHVRNELPHELPEGATTEEVFLKTEKDEVERLQAAAGELETYGELKHDGRQTSSSGAMQDLNPDDVLRVLKSDMYR